LQICAGSIKTAGLVAFIRPPLRGKVHSLRVLDPGVFCRSLSRGGSHRKAASRKNAAFKKPHGMFTKKLHKPETKAPEHKNSKHQGMNERIKPGHNVRVYACECRL
jgi:hypothetical protein